MKLDQIVNIMPDDKFIDNYIHMYNKFIERRISSSHLVFYEGKSPHYVKSEDRNLKFLKRTRDNYDLVLNNLDKNVKAVIFHSFNLKQTKLIQNIPAHIKKIWIFWGHEGYAVVNKFHYLDKASYLANFENRNIGLVNLVKEKLVSVLGISGKARVSRDIIKEMDYCATWIKDDFSLVHKVNPKMKYLYFSYFHTGLFEKEMRNFDYTKESRKILLGNSASPNNNHIDALNFLNKINFKGTIIVPLSYGGNNNYVEKIIELGKKLFKSDFKPLVEFMSLDEYVKIVNDCDIVWMNHIRQQAAGNLLNSFYFKKIVILNDKSYFRNTFLEWKLKFYERNILKNLELIDITDLENNHDIIDEKVSIEMNKPFFQQISQLIA